MALLGAFRVKLPDIIATLKTLCYVPDYFILTFPKREPENMEAVLTEEQEEQFGRQAQGSGP